MRMFFGLISLLIALAIVGSVAKTQLHALSGSSISRLSTAASDAQIGNRDGATIAIPGGMPGATPADTSGLTVPQQSQNIQQQFKDATNRALQQGADRSAKEQP
ncbi:MAG: hypothetical protein E6H58_01255 [Betaproteobacteria bacterium]|nr:MAG: hypothetical protein E6H65_10855 [Betaproteobacteria bacterium]TMH36744.1 MAG: hypothetical protein E6H58_01255 [Betaproteobacteria bacterium]